MILVSLVKSRDAQMNHCVPQKCKSKVHYSQKVCRFPLLSPLPSSPSVIFLSSQRLLTAPCSRNCVQMNSDSRQWPGPASASGKTHSSSGTSGLWSLPCELWKPCSVGLGAGPGPPKWHTNGRKWMLQPLLTEDTHMHPSPHPCQRPVGEQQHDMGQLLGLHEMKAQMLCVLYSPSCHKSHPSARKQGVHKTPHFL